GVTNETIAVNVATMYATVKCISAVKAARVIEVSMCAIGVIVAIYECSAARDIDVAVVHDAAVMPVVSPVVPTPAETAKEADRITDTKQNSRCGNKQSWIPIPVWPSHQRCSIHNPRIVFGN